MPTALRRLCTLFAAIALLLAACGDDDHNHDHDGEEHGAEEEACEHLAEGPFAEVTATDASDSDPPSIAVEHTRVNVALTAIEGGNGGFVTFPATEAAEFIFFLSDDVPVEIFDPMGNEVIPELTEMGSELCDDIAIAHHVDLEIGTYTLLLGPTDVTSVGIVHEEAGAEHDHEE